MEVVRVEKRDPDTVAAAAAADTAGVASSAAAAATYRYQRDCLTNGVGFYSHGPTLMYPENYRGQVVGFYPTIYVGAFMSKIAGANEWDNRL